MVMVGCIRSERREHYSSVLDFCIKMCESGFSKWEIYTQFRGEAQLIAIAFEYDQKCQNVEVKVKGGNAVKT